jgi:hypothetical protein
MHGGTCVAVDSMMGFAFCAGIKPLPPMPMRRVALSSYLHSLNMATETLAPRPRKNKLRTVKKKDEGNRPSGLWWFPRIHLKPYENEEGYFVDPFYIKPAFKVVAVALLLAVFMAALKPPPFVPRNYLYQVRM